MSGHSKWSNIKHKKGKSDAARAKIFTKIGREIAVAVKQGGPDPNLNSKLFDIIVKARSNNMPNDNVQRSIKKASGELSTINYEEMIYEGYGIGGSAVIVESLTDNKNRTAGDVRFFFDKHGGALGANGCVSFMFDKKGVIIVERVASANDESMMEIALEAGALDIEIADDVYEIYTSVIDFNTVKNAMAGQCNIISAELEWIPQNTVTLDDEKREKFEKMLDVMDDCDDIQNVYHNVVL